MTTPKITTVVEIENCDCVRCRALREAAEIEKNGDPKTELERLQLQRLYDIILF
jgi:hypothetical protein